MTTSIVRRYVPKDATKPLNFKISETHVVAAKCGDEKQCVIAQAVSDALGDLFEAIEVGSSITKVIRADKVKVRYGTPSKLRRALVEFDLTGKWNLPPGEYTLLVPPPSAKLGARPNRWAKKHVNKTSSGQDRFKGRALPTRRVARCDGLCVVNA